MVLVAYRHGLRAAELVDLRWDEFSTATLHVRRAKAGTPSTHPILGDELRSLRRLQREQAPKSPFVFTSERGAPFTTAGLARMIERVGKGPSWGSRRTRICYGTPAVTPWLTGGMTHGRCKLTSGTRTYNTPFATLNCRPTDSRIFGANKQTARCSRRFTANGMPAERGMARRNPLPAKSGLVRDNLDVHGRSRLLVPAENILLPLLDNHRE